jgi:hypothetical protein
MQVQELSPTQQIDVFVRARYPVVWVVSQEEARVQAALAGWLDAHNTHRRFKGLPEKPGFTWTISRGIVATTNPPEAIGVGVDDPIGALQEVATHGVTEENPAGAPAVFVFKDLDPWLQDPRVERALRDVIVDLAGAHRTLIVISATLAIPESCRRQVAVVEWPLPTLEELVDLLDDFVADLTTEHPEIPCTLNGDREAVAKALQGLTEFQAVSVLTTTVVATGRLSVGAVDFIIHEKARLIKASGVLEFYQPEDLPEIGGLDLLKDYLSKRGRAFSDEATEFGLKTPKGLLLVGVPGCGKSLASKTLATMWRLPLLRLDVGTLMGSLVGQSEANLRQALKVAESASPAILWLDEIEKGLSGVKSSGAADGGTTARVFGALLTWLQEKTAPVYVVATSNDIQALPPELLRAGRFDDIFFVDLPNREERREIWLIHLIEARRDPKAYDLEALANLSDGFTGAEIETTVGDALYSAFDAGRDLTDEDLRVAIEGRVPLKQTMGEQIQALREWARRRAKAASSPVDATTGRSSRVAMMDV